MHNFSWLDERIDITGVRLYSFREKEFMTIGHQPEYRNPTRLNLYNQLEKMVQMRNDLNQSIEDLEALLQRAGRRTFTKKVQEEA